MLDNSCGEEIFPNIQSKPPLVQLEAISSFLEMFCYVKTAVGNRYDII